MADLHRLGGSGCGESDRPGRMRAQEQEQEHAGPMTRNPDPPSAEHFRKLERAYAGARINEYYAPTLRISEGRAELAIEAVEKMHHAARAIHGSVYFKALDDAAFFAVNSVVTDVFVLTVSFTVQFLRPVSEGRLRALGTLTHRTGRLFFAESTLHDADGNPIGRGNGIFTRSKIPLDEGVGYR